MKPSIFRPAEIDGASASVGRQRQGDTEENEHTTEQSHTPDGPVARDERDVEDHVVAEPDEVDEQFREEDVEEADGEGTPARESAFR
jgi:hypothetical protein